MTAAILAPDATETDAPAARPNPYRAELTARLVEMIETNTAPWQKPWTPTGSPAIPHNAKTGAMYRGSNTFWLICEMLRNGWTDPRFMTYKQADAAGYQVMKGSKGTTIEYWQQTSKTETMADPDGGTDLISIRPRMIHRTYRVFNAAQIEGMPALETTDAPVVAWEPYHLAEMILTESGANISHNGYDRAFYAPALDSITLPDRAAFADAASYYATALHELGHWTGHASRLDRNMTGGQGSHAYAMEELIAESGTYLLCLSLGIPFNPVQTAAYCQGWAKPLAKNPHALAQALAAGNKAADFMAQYAEADEMEAGEHMPAAAPVFTIPAPMPETVAAQAPAPAPVVTAAACPECTAATAPDDMFCRKCGYRLQAMPAPDARDYVIATTDAAPVIIATVTHTDLTAPAQPFPAPGERTIHASRDEADARRTVKRARRKADAETVAAQEPEDTNPGTVAVLSAPLARALKQLATVSDSKTAAPVILTASGDDLTVTVATETAYVSRHLASYNKTAAAWTVTLPQASARNLAAVLATTNETAKLTPNGKTLALTIGKDSQAFTLDTDAETPDAPHTPNEMVRIDAAILARHIATVAPGAAKSDTRPILAGIAFDTAADSLVLVTSDGFTLAQSDTTHGTAHHETLPVTLKPLAKWATAFAKAKHNEATVTYGNGWLTISTDDGRETWSARLIDGTYPNWRQVIAPAVNTPALVVNTAELLTATKSAALFARDANDAVTYTYDETERAIVVTARAAERGTVTRYVNASGPAPVNGTAAALNSKYVLTALKNAGPTSTLAITGASTPALINGNVIMPMVIAA